MIFQDNIYKYALFKLNVLRHNFRNLIYKVQHLHKKKPHNHYQLMAPSYLITFIPTVRILEFIPTMNIFHL